MKKIKCLLILLLFMPILYVKADECGNYKTDDGEILSGVTWDGTFVFYKGEKIGASNKCPEEIYYYSSTTTMDGFDRYSVETDARIGMLKKIYAQCQSGDCYVAPTVDPTPEVPLTPSNKYDYIETCEGGPYEYIAECGCMPTALTDLTSRIYNLVKILAPALLIIVGGFDLIKAVTAADEKAIQKEQTKLIKKFIAAFAVFMLFTVIQLLTQWISKDPGNTIDCVGYIVNGWSE